MSETGAGRRVTFRDVLADREFRALYIAMACSVTGDQLARIAVALLVFSRTHSPLLIGISYAVTYLPWLVGGPLLSGYADRRPRRQVMVVCDIGRALLVLAAAAPGMPTATLIVIIMLVAVLGPPFGSARASMVPDIVGEGERYAVASTLGTTTNQLAGVLGFGAGGAVVALTGAHVALLLDALSFAASAWVLLRSVHHRPAVVTQRNRYGAELLEGARLVFADHRLRFLVVMSWVLVAATIGTEAVAVPYAHAHGGGAAAAGALTAALPLGTVLGTLVVGRMLPIEWAEPLMMPMALLTPAVLAFTAFDPQPVVVGLLWVVTGFLSSAVVVANRIFVARVPREARGRAFGIAVAGLAGWQGIGTVVAGALTAAVGPARATADLALPAFAILALFALVGPASSGFRTGPKRPMPHVDLRQAHTGETEEGAMTAARRQPERRVWALSAVLVAVDLTLIPMLRGDPPYLKVHLQPWWLTILFVIGLAYPMVFRYRRQSWAVSLETVPLVLGLLFVSPFQLLVSYLIASLISGTLIRRSRFISLVFNLTSRAAALIVAIAAFHLVVPDHAGVHVRVWPALFAAVIAHELISAALVAAAVSLTDRQWRLRNSLRVFSLSLPVVIVITFLAISTAAALRYDLSTTWAITVFVVLTAVGLRAYHRLADRSAALDRLHTVARELGPLAAGAKDLAPALIQLRRILKAFTIELSVASGADPNFVTVLTTALDPLGSDQVNVDERVLEGGPESLLGSGAGLDRRLPWLPRPTQRSRRQDDTITAPLKVAGRVTGVLVARGNAEAFESTDLRLLAAAADQFSAALEKGRLVDSLRRAATRDSLTELANLDSLRVFLSTMLEAGSGGVLLLFDIDRFHEVNDMLGHEAGDAVLIEVARRLESSPSHGALACRVGSDQFALAIPGAAGSEVARLAALAVKSRVDGSLRFAEVSADVRVTIGIARAPEHGNDAATLLRRAEMAMTAAKGTSSGIGEWEPNYERDGSRRLQLLTGLRAALADGDLRVEYQPKIQLGSGEVIGFEALVRWRHPELGPVSPAEFVPLAEATGLISALTSTVMRSALATCRSWHDAGKPVGIAVNISARGLDDPVLVGQVAAMLTASGLEPRWLTLEITESSVMENPARSLEVLRQLRMLGVRLSIDDFGTGYSSLHQLRGLPVHEVKIDRSFVEAVDEDGADRAVVHAVVELCESLGLTAVAEGVERASQAYALQSLGVREVQGYFHGRPMAPTAALEWLLPRRAAPIEDRVS